MMEWLNRALWATNFLVILELVYQWRPLLRGKCYGSRHASLIGIVKYAVPMVLNFLMGNAVMYVWMGIGLIKEIGSYLMLSRIKKEEGINI